MDNFIHRLYGPYTRKETVKFDTGVRGKMSEGGAEIICQAHTDIHEFNYLAIDRAG